MRVLSTCIKIWSSVESLGSVAVCLLTTLICTSRVNYADAFLSRLHSQLRLEIGWTRRQFDQKEGKEEMQKKNGTECLEWEFAVTISTHRPIDRCRTEQRGRESGISLSGSRPVGSKNDRTVP